MSQDYDVITVGYFQLEDCHGDLYAVQVDQDKGHWGDFPPDGTTVQGMGFYDQLAGDELVLDQTELLGTGPGGAFIIGPDNAIGGFTPFEDFVYQDGDRTFYAAVTDSLSDSTQVGDSQTASPSTLNAVHQAYYLPVISGVSVTPPTLTSVLSPAELTLAPSALALTNAHLADPAPGSAVMNPNGGSAMSSVATARTAMLSTELAPLGTSGTVTTLTPGFFGSAATRFTKMSDSAASALAGLGIVGNVLPAPARNGLVDYLYWNFRELYHPYVCQLIGTIYRSGPDGLFTRGVEVDQSFDYFATQYQPTSQITLPYPLENYDFTQTGGYAQYNWELFFHVPLLIATRLKTNQQFEDAQKWFHYIFNPTDASSDTAPQKYWITQPFFEHTAADYRDQQIQRLLQLINQNSSDSELAKQVAQWQAHPFNPHLIARLRTVAYQKATVMKYLDNLIAWADQLFRRDTIETINEATQLYILAAEILGRRPEEVAERATIAPETYDSLEPRLDGFSNALVAVENLVPPVKGSVGPPPLPFPFLPHTLYFCCPKNDKLMGYWDTIADRIFNIRHSRNIEGVYQQLPLFEPPIDPALLVAATAAGVDISSALNDLNAPAPLYRFSVMMEKANAFCAEVKSMGAAFMAALEKSDGESMALLRSSNEIALLNAVKNVKVQQVQEAADVIDGLQKSKAVIQIRHDYYAGLQFTVGGESAHLEALSTVSTLESVQRDLAAVASVLFLLPELKVGFPTTIGASLGGSNVGNLTAFAKEAIGHHTADTSVSGTSAVTMAGYQRRFADYQFQASMAAAELVQIQSQIETATLRWRIAQTEVDNQDLLITNAQSVDDLMHSKFTNQELYDWMVNQAAGVYFQAYQLAYDIAKRTEAGYRFELGITDANYQITFGYWDSLRQGLLAGERLGYDLKQLEFAYLEKHRREYEITKYISLAALSPRQLVNLRETGSCLFDIPEWLFDLDYPGHYMRRLKAVTVTIPSVTGPYTSVNATLTLGANSVRLNTTGSGYARTGINDTRFKDNFASVQSIVTSTAQNDSGMFELNFHDDRYLPFEGGGTISTWWLDMPPSCNAFDFETVTDVIMKVSYTARDGGVEFRQTVQKAVALPPAPNLARLTSAVHDFSNDWYRFQHPADLSATTFTLQTTIGPERFPFLYRNRITAVNELTVIVRPAEGQDPSTFVGDTFNLIAPNGSTATLTLVPGDLSGATYALPFATASLGSAKPFGQWSLSTTLAPATVADILLVFRYTVS
jgi:Tc toxin complex TcA C-terminal TcB-binding domain